MKRLLAIFMAAVLGGWAMQAQAMSYMDEDFEGPSAFVNQANPPLTWPVMDSGSTQPSVTPKGINLRCHNVASAYDWGSDGATGDQAGDNFQDIVMNQSGVISNARAFKGARSYQLSSGQSLFPTPNSFPWPRDDWYRFWQFAVSVDSATAALDAGTEIGTYKINWSTNGLNSEDEEPEVTLTLSFTAIGGGQVEIVCENNATVLGTLNGGDSSWHLISIISCGNITPSTTDDPGYANGMLWQCWDPITQQYKGPQPSNPSIPPDQVGTGHPEMIAHYPQTPGGVYIFVNSNTESTFLSPAVLGNNWGNPPEGPNRLCAETGWRFDVANGSLYLDEMFWGGSGFQGATRLADQEQAARIQPFNATADAPAPNAVRNWEIF